ncbi:MAG TPA: hypothetical protein VHB02_20000 [Acidimicrobiales bacterium]|nr:hypothetical protein [Acidimicrobiales bacterium]
MSRQLVATDAKATLLALLADRGRPHKPPYGPLATFLRPAVAASASSP